MQRKMRVSASRGLAGRAIVALVASFAVSLWAFWPSLGAYFFLDDYAFVAISRYTDHPLAFYLSEQFLGGFFYRPRYRRSAMACEFEWQG